MSLPRLATRNISNQSKGVSMILANWGAPGEGPETRRLRRKNSQEDFSKDSIQPPPDYQQVSTMVTESPILESGKAGDFRDEFQINSRGPVKLQRPMSNQLRQQNSFAVPPSYDLPPLLGADRMMKFNSSVDGKALLHDLDMKFDTQDKMINYLISQINTLEGQVSTMNRKTQSIAEQERAERNKLETTLKYDKDQQHYNINEVMQKINFLDDALKREEKTRTELRDKLRVADENNRELMNFIKSIQSQSDQELTQMRTFLQEKLNEDHLGSIKQKEKSTVLFNEVVRLGQEYEKQIEYLQGLNSNYENRIQTLESRIASTEQSANIIEKRGDINQNMVSDLVEKLESKILNMEQNYHFLKNEHMKERENLSRLEISSLRYNEDFKNVLGQVQNEFQGRLEIKITDLVNRLMLEQEERMRSIEDVRYQIDIKDKMSLEKQKNERDEMRDRYAAMDAVVRAEFQRKDEAILSLQNSLETQIRTINGWVKQEELARTQQEIGLRTEIGKVADNIRYDVEGFKGQQVQVTEKLTEMIRMEVDSRLTSDKESKQLIQGLIKNVMIEVAGVKETSDKTLQKLMKDVKDCAHDSAERSHFLSRYIDEEVIKIGQKVTKQIDNIKTLCAKLTEQFKKHLINHENMKKDIYKRFEIIETHLPVYRTELYKVLEQTEARCLGKMKEVKDAIEQTMLTNFQVLDERVDQFSELVDSNMDTLRKAIQDNREVFVTVINKTNEELEGRYNGFVEDLEKVVQEVFNMQLKLDTSDKNLKQDSTKLNKIVNDLEAHINTSFITEKSVRKAQDQALAEEMDRINKKLAVVSDKIHVRIDEEGNQVSENTNKIENFLKENKRDIEKLSTEVTELMYDFKDHKDKAIRDTGSLASGLEIETMTSRLESKDIYAKLTALIQNFEGSDATMKEKMQKLLDEPEEVKKAKEEQELQKYNEMMDAKVESAFERLRNDNLYIWKQSLQLAEQEFSQKGVGVTMNFLPKTILEKDDLKRTINSLMLEESTIPKPSLKQNAKGINPPYKPKEEEKIAVQSLDSSNTPKGPPSKQPTPNQQQTASKQPTPAGSQIGSGTPSGSAQQNPGGSQTPAGQTQNSQLLQPPGSKGTPAQNSSKGGTQKSATGTPSQNKTTKKTPAQVE